MMVTRLILAALLVAGLAGCGQKGPLYNPHPSQMHQQQAIGALPAAPSNRAKSE